MFCEKCGNPLPYGSKFCEKCGNPVAMPQQDPAQPQQAPAQPQQAPVQPQQAPAQPQQAPVQPQQAPVQPQQAPVQPQQAPVQPQQAPAQPQQAPAQPQQAPVQPQQAPVQPQQGMPAYQQPAPQTPKAPKKPLSPGVKKAILFGGIGAAVVIIGLIVLFAAVIPSLNTIDVSKYVEVSFSESGDKVYNGDIKGSVNVSYKNIYIDKLGDEESQKIANSKKDGEDYSISDYEDILKGTGTYAKASALYTIINDLDVSCKIKDQEKSTEETTKGSSSSSTSFEHAKKNDTLIVTIKWPTDEYKRKEVEQQESISGLRFDKSDKVVEIKLEDKLKSSKLNITEKVEVDFVKVINDKNLITVKGTPENYPDAVLNEFEYTQGDYKFTNENPKKDKYHSYNKIVVTNTKNGDEEKSFYVSFDSLSSAKEGDEIEYTFNGDTEHLYDTDVFFTATKGSFKYKPNHALTLDEAKKNAEKISETISNDINSIDSSIKDSSNISVEEIYFVTEKDEPEDEKAKLYVFYKNTSTGKYKYMTVTDSYVRDSKYFYGYASESWSTYKSVAACQEYLSPFYKSSKDDYNTTKVY